VGVTKFLARDLLIEVLDPASGGDYVEIKGVEGLTHSPSSTLANTTDFASEGRMESLMAERGDEFTLVGFRMEDTVNGDRDPGQEIVEALGDEISVASVGTFRITTPGGLELNFGANVEVTRLGGGHNDPSAWGAKLTVSGAITPA
jgi:hypothetical protein